MEYNIVEVIAASGTALVGIFGGMWAMFRSLQKNYLEHLEKSENRMVEMMTTKNGHLERIAKSFSENVKDFQSVLSMLSEKIDNLNDKYDRGNK